MNRFEQFKQAYPQPEGVFEDEAECLKELDQHTENWDQILQGARNFAASRKAREGIGVYKPLTFLRKEKWRDWQVVKEPLGREVCEAWDALIEAARGPKSAMLPPMETSSEELFFSLNIPWREFQDRVNAGKSVPAVNG